MEAKITVTMTPREFDLTREAITDAHNNALFIAQDRSTDPAMRQAGRQRAVELDLLIGKLN